MYDVLFSFFFKNIEFGPIFVIEHICRHKYFKQIFLIYWMGKKFTKRERMSRNTSRQLALARRVQINEERTESPVKPASSLPFPFLLHMGHAGR